MKDKDQKDLSQNEGHDNNEVLEEPTMVEPEIEDVLDQDETTEVEPDEEARLTKELEETKVKLEKAEKEYLFLMAEFDNFRKRVLKEKAELIKNGSEKALKGVLPIVDDMERGLDASKDAGEDDPIRQGMVLIYNKLIKYLADNGVKAMDTESGVAFDSDIHEAVAMIPAQDDEQKGKIIDTTQKGYMLNDKVLRHAKVVVAQ